jgi:hypothetical protein
VGGVRPDPTPSLPPFGARPRPTIAFYRLFGFELRPYLRERSFYLTAH